MTDVGRYGRLNLEGTVLSKRKLQLLVQGGHVRGWNDPRLYTLIALKRRGIPPGAILSFVNSVGVTKANTSIETAKFEQDTRKYLETTVPRLMVVPDPIPVIVDSLPEDYLEMVDVDFPNDPNTEVRLLSLCHPRGSGHAVRPTKHTDRHSIVSQTTIHPQSLHRPQ